MQACLLIFMLMSVLPMPACLVPTEAIISFGITKGYEPHLGGETKSGPLQKHWQSSLGVHALTAASPPPLPLPPHAILPMSVCTYFQKFSFRFRATMLQHNLILAYISPKKKCASKSNHIYEHQESGSLWRKLCTKQCGNLHKWT